MADHQIITAANGSRWTVSATTPNFYGRPIPVGREFWALRIEGEAPAELSGVLGFYAPSVAAVLSRLNATRKAARFEWNAAGAKVRALYQTAAGPVATDWFDTEAAARAAIPS